MLRVPVRVAPVFASKVKITIALPMPLVLVALTCSQPLFVPAIQVLLAGVAVSNTEPVPAAGPSTIVVEPSTYTPVTMGETVATWTGAPLEPPKVVTTAVRLPTAAGGVVKSTVSEVAVAAVTVPAAPSLNATVLLAAVVEKFAPDMTMAGALITRFAVFGVTVGAATMLATCTAPLEPMPVTVTLAVRLPRVVGWVVKVTVSEVVVAAVTVPAAPSLNATVLPAAVDEKFAPEMVTAGALTARFAVLIVTVGAMAMVATCTGPLDPPNTETLAVKLPTAAGWVVKVTVSEVVVAAVTVPAAPSLKTTVSLAAVELKLVPVIVRVGAVINRLAALKVTVGAATRAAT